MAPAGSLKGLFGAPDSCLRGNHDNIG